MSAPVHAPVPGAGTPTKSASASVRDWPVGSPASFLSARLSSGAISFLTKGERSARSIGAIGAMLPSTQIANVVAGPSPIHAPTGTPPRSSIAGVAEMRQRTAQSGRPERWKKSATFWPRCRCSAAPAPPASAAAGAASASASASALRAAPRGRGGAAGVPASRIGRASGARAATASGRAAARRATTGAPAWKPSAGATRSAPKSATDFIERQKFGRDCPRDASS